MDRGKVVHIASGKIAFLLIKPYFSVSLALCHTHPHVREMMINNGYTQAERHSCSTEWLKRHQKMTSEYTRSLGSTTSHHRRKQGNHAMKY